MSEYQAIIDKMRRDEPINASDAIVYAQQQIKDAVEEEREACAKVAEDEARIFLSPSYATGQPLSSINERFACKQVAAAIRARSNTQA